MSLGHPIYLLVIKHNLSLCLQKKVCVFHLALLLVFYKFSEIIELTHFSLIGKTWVILLRSQLDNKIQIYGQRMMGGGGREKWCKEEEEERQGGR